MDVGTGQQLCVPIIEPFLLDHCLAFGTVSVPAGVAGVSRMAAPIARFDMAAERGGTAYLDAPHDLALLSGEYVLIPVLHPLSAADIGPLQRCVIFFHLIPPALRPSDRADSCAGRSGPGPDADR